MTTPTQDWRQLRRDLSAALVAEGHGPEVFHALELLAFRESHPIYSQQADRIFDELLVQFAGRSEGEIVEALHHEERAARNAVRGTYQKPPRGEIATWIRIRLSGKGTTPAWATAQSIEAQFQRRLNPAPMRAAARIYGDLRQRGIECGGVIIIARNAAQMAKRGEKK